MAHTVESFPAHRGRPPKYDWESWVDGQNWVLEQGTDFDSDIRSFRTLVHRTKDARGLNAKTWINKANNTITVKFWEKSPAERDRWEVKMAEREQAKLEKKATVNA